MTVKASRKLPAAAADATLGAPARALRRRARFVSGGMPPRHPSDAVEPPRDPAPAGRSRWVVPTLRELPRLTDLTLATFGDGIGGGGGTGGGGSTVF